MQLPTHTPYHTPILFNCMFFVRSAPHLHNPRPHHNSRGYQPVEIPSCGHIYAQPISTTCNIMAADACMSQPFSDSMTAAGNAGHAAFLSTPLKEHQPCLLFTCSCSCPLPLTSHITPFLSASYRDPPYSPPPRHLQLDNPRSPSPKTPFPLSLNAFSSVSPQTTPSTWISSSASSPGRQQAPLHPAHQGQPRRTQQSRAACSTTWVALVCLLVSLLTNNPCGHIGVSPGACGSVCLFVG